MFNTGSSLKVYKMKIFPSFTDFQTRNKEQKAPDWRCYEAVGKSEAFSTLSIIGLLGNLSIFLQSFRSVHF